MPSSLADVDGNAESRRGTISVFDGPVPAVQIFDDADAEQRGVGAWIAGRIREGCKPNEIAVFVRAEEQLKRAREAVKRAGVTAMELNDKIEAETSQSLRGHAHVRLPRAAHNVDRMP